jgi:hypothetical protein
MQTRVALENALRFEQDDSVREELALALQDLAEGVSNG